MSFCSCYSNLMPQAIRVRQLVCLMPRPWHELISLTIDIIQSFGNIVSTNQRWIGSLLFVSDFRCALLCLLVLFVQGAKSNAAWRFLRRRNFYNYLTFQFVTCVGTGYILRLKFVLPSSPPAVGVSHDQVASESLSNLGAQAPSWHASVYSCISLTASTTPLAHQGL